MKKLTYYLRCVDNCISVKQEDREPYTARFNEIRDWLIERMRWVSPVFNKVFTEPILFGSYPNRVRLDPPKEFDVLLGLDFPFILDLTLDTARPGFLHIEMSDSVDTNSIDADVYELFTYMVDYRTGKLRRGRLQWWIYHIITNVLKRYNQPYWCDIIYNKRAVAHNIYVREKSGYCREFGIDFLPAVYIGEVDWMHIRGYYPLKREYFYNFYAIPKKGGKLPARTGSFTFMLINPMAERELLWDKQNLKVAYRLIKSLRDRYEMDRFKSAFITHAFLWEVKRRKEHFWHNHVGDILIYMLEKLWQYFNSGNLNYFWVKDMNMLDILRKDEITEYAQKLQHALKSLKYLDSKNRRLTWYEVAEHFDIPDTSDEDD